MPKAELTTFVTPKCQQLADSMGLELVDVCLDKEGAGKYLRIYLDKPEGLTMDDCEKFHRAIQPQLEKYDYDFLEVSSPGIDRPLKTPRDYERHLGDEVEVKLFKAVDGVKLFTGILARLDEGKQHSAGYAERAAVLPEKGGGHGEARGGYGRH